ncbi:hypothetical protein WH297_24925 [Ochrobactrum vermis]|uniref:Uncharacterized protein n=1 Tax=Ochrobactrum vermis TaxID=1827297 RepID=A0ABU8PL43_9HYPH|nr:hypothetical protein [Ochrobactrum vermis]PQZ24346.1 hypothetical protein CQZ93_25250 [Ochrobactrum vermis]
MASSRQQSERLRKQRERQKNYRDRLKADRKPTRDDIARIVLHFMVLLASEADDPRSLDQLINRVLEALKEQGYDEDASLDVLDDLIAKYTKTNWGFRRKMHLGADKVLDGTGY